MYDNILLPQLNIDDFIIFEDMGAYAMALACRFNRVPEPKIEYYIQRKHWYALDLLIFRKHIQFNISLGEIIQFNLFIGGTGMR